MTFFRSFFWLAPVALAAALLSPSTALAAPGPEACGKFDFTKNGFSCRIAVSGGCEAECTPVKFTAYCDGGCSLGVTQTCADSCETLCVKECDPDHLDCVAGCHTECEQPFIDQCKAEHPDRDCVADAKASCNMHCSSACGVTASDCLSHCHECCHGACMSQINLDCDIGCFAKVEGGCSAHCQEPTGALFCNDQYVYASDVQGCIDYLLTQGITVDVSARASATCDLDGCDVESAVKGAGCAAAPAGQSGRAQPVVGALSVVALAAALRGVRNRRRR